MENGKLVNDMTWRKFPRELLTNDAMAYIAEQFAPELRAAPYMFYVTALCKADDDGIFDLEDGVMFSRAMKIGTINDLAKIANLMQKMHIITRVSDKSNKCILNDWDYPKTVKTRTMAQRRQIVMDQIKEAEAKKSATTRFTAEDLQQAGQENDSPAIELDLSVKNSDDFFCHKNDKNEENVAKTDLNDKNAQIVERTEREIRQDKITEDKTSLEKKHTEEAETFPGYDENPSKVSAEKPAVAEIEKNTEAENQNENDADDIQNLEADQNADDISFETQDEHTAGIINSFFVKYCYGYNPKQARKHVMELISRINELSNDMNPPDVITNIFLAEFRKMAETPGQHWYNTPLLPAYMIKDGIFSHIMARASRILLSNASQKEQWSKQMQHYKEKMEQQMSEVCDGIDDEYLKYGISPDDPSRAAKLLAAKVAGGKKEE